jgi:hypothetical protein
MYGNNQCIRLLDIFRLFNKPLFIVALLIFERIFADMNGIISVNKTFSLYMVSRMIVPLFRMLGGV